MTNKEILEQIKAEYEAICKPTCVNSVQTENDSIEKKSLFEKLKLKIKKN